MSRNLLCTPEPSYLRPQQLIEIAQSLTVRESTFPTIDMIINKIDNHQIEQISLLEWVYCLHQKTEWDQENPRAQETSDSIWKIALSHSELCQRLVSYLALYYSDCKTHELAESLVKAFPIFVKLAQGEQQFVVQVLQALQIKDITKVIKALAQLICQHDLTPREFQKKLGDQIPSFIPAIANLHEYTSLYFTSLASPTELQINWFMRCLNELDVTQDTQPDPQSITVNQLLLNLPVEQAEHYPKITKWLRERYDRRSTSSGWHKLSDLAKQNLQQWIGGISYADFDRLAGKLLQRLFLDSTEERQRNQLRSRRTFWSHYSKKFQGDLRILLPQSSVHVLGTDSFPASDILLEDGSDPTEICIFKLGELLIVEFFRGRGSETRIFPHSVELENCLFSNSRLSVKRIRGKGGRAFDHAFGWQGICTRHLESHNISANPGTTEFAGLPRHCNQYTPGEGLRRLNEDEKSERKRSLRTWEPEMIRLQREANDFCNRSMELASEVEYRRIRSRGRNRLGDFSEQE
jgi:hypothetical protein